MIRCCRLSLTIHNLQIPTADSLDTRPKNTFEKEATKRSSGEIDDELARLQRSIDQAKKKREIDAAAALAKKSKKMKKLPMPSCL